MELKTQRDRVHPKGHCVSHIFGFKMSIQKASHSCQQTRGSSVGLGQMVNINLEIFKIPKGRTTNPAAAILGPMIICMEREIYFFLWANEQLLRLQAILVPLTWPHHIPLGLSKKHLKIKCISAWRIWMMIRIHSNC